MPPLPTNTSSDSEPFAALPTSRLASRPERSVLAIVRAVVPRRPLSPREAAVIAELQANRLLELAHLTGPPVPEELISELPRIRLRRDVDLPTSGATDWLPGHWLISINSAEPYSRQRFSLAHEFKHVLDDRDSERIYRPRPELTAHDQAEYAAEYFAACLLMPKRWLRAAYYSGIQKVSELSRLFLVSPRAMQRRLLDLGLRDPAARCPDRLATSQRHDGATSNGHETSGAAA
jgi:hypothetical protein